jgi:hypothetical protein
VSELLAQEALAELNAVVAADGAVLRLVRADAVAVEVELDVSQSSCPECVVPQSLLEGILRDRLAQIAPDVTSVVLHDPRET